MRKNAHKVIECFLRGQPCRGDSKGTISTDGTTVFSYRMPVAWRTDRCVDHADCAESEQLGVACAARSPLRVIAYSDAPTATTRSQVRALQLSLPGAITVDAGRGGAVVAGPRKHR